MEQTGFTIQHAALGPGPIKNLRHIAGVDPCVRQGRQGVDLGLLPLP